MTLPGHLQTSRPRTPVWTRVRAPRAPGFAFRRLAAVLAVLFPGCLSSTAPDTSSPISPSSPIQVNSPSPIVLEQWDGGSLYAALVTPDSLLQVTWHPSAMVVETSGGFRDTVMLQSPWCLLPTGRQLPFPDNYDWVSCDRISFNTSVVLSRDRFAQIAGLVSGDTLSSYVLKAPSAYYPGVVATYTLHVPIGLDATEIARRRVASQPEVKGAERPAQQPMCVLGAQCPLWYVAAVLRYSFSDSRTEGVIPVEAGGWLRVSYRQANDTVLTATWSFPQ